MGMANFELLALLIHFDLISFSTPDKLYYSKIRAAFVTPGTTAHPTHASSYSRANDNDLPFVLMMQQQENHQQHSMEQEHSSSKTPLHLAGDLDNETAPDDFILVEVVRNRTIDSVCFLSTFFSRNHSLVKVTRPMIWRCSFVRVNNLPCSSH